LWLQVAAGSYQNLWSEDQKMPRPRKGTEEVWYDTFAGWPEEDREAALKVLTHLHRALSRARIAAPDFANEALILTDPDPELASAEEVATLRRKQ
jgi:hypothetical protein